MRLGDGVIGALGEMAAAVIAVWGTWTLARRKERATLAQDIQKAASYAIKDLTTLAETLQREVARVTGMRDEIARHHEECRTELEAGRREREAMKRQIDRLMAEPIAPYPGRRQSNDTD